MIKYNLQTFSKELMDAIKAAGWTRFKPVKGQPIAEQDMKKVFKLVDMDKSGAISQLVGMLLVKLVIYHDNCRS